MKKIMTPQTKVA
ncbi:hypothetical protein CP061683_1103A, partial [Chlamydia psittaci 06-1683]